MFIKNIYFLIKLVAILILVIGLSLYMIRKSKKRKDDKIDK